MLGKEWWPDLEKERDIAKRVARTPWDAINWRRTAKFRNEWKALSEEAKARRITGVI